MGGIEANPVVTELGLDNYPKNSGRECLSPSAVPASPGRKYSASRGVLVTAGSNLMLSVLGVLTGVMAARLLGPKGRGELAAIQAWPTALASLGLLGMSEAVPYFCTRETEKRGAYLSAALLIGLAGALYASKGSLSG